MAESKNGDSKIDKVKELLEMSRDEIKNKFQISGKKGKEGTTFIAETFAIKMFATTKKTDPIEKEFNLQKRAALFGVAPQVYGFNPTSKIIIMDKMKETIVEWKLRSVEDGTLELAEDGTIVLPEKFQKQIYTLCVQLDKAEVMQNDGNPLNLMFNEDNKRLFMIDYGFSKQIKAAIIKKRGKHPNLGTTLWHFNKDLQHYKIFCDKLQIEVDKYDKDKAG